MLQTIEQMELISHIGLRPYLLERGLQKSGATPKTTIWMEVRYAAVETEIPRSSAMGANAGMIAAALKVLSMAEKATRHKFESFCREH